MHELTESRNTLHKCETKGGSAVIGRTKCFQQHMLDRPGVPFAKGQLRFDSFILFQDTHELLSSFENLNDQVNLILSSFFRIAHQLCSRCVSCQLFLRLSRVLLPHHVSRATLIRTWKSIPVESRCRYFCSQHLFSRRMILQNNRDFIPTIYICWWVC